MRSGRSVAAMNRPMRVLAVAMVFLAAGCSSGGSSDGAGDRAGKATTTTKAATTTTVSKPEPLEDQTPPASINGLVVQGDTIWVASIKDDQILQIDRESGAILQRFDTEGAGPDDVAVAPDGSIWSTGFVNGDLGRIDGGRYETVMNVEPGINPLEFGPDGTLYLGTYGPDGRLYSLETDGGAPMPGTQELKGAPAEVRAEGLPDINAFGILDDGTIVSPAGGVAGPGSAIAIDPGSGTHTTIVGDLPGVAAGTTDSDGNPYLLANATGEVIAIDVEAKTSKVVQTVKQGAPFDNLSFADDGTMYLSSFVAPTITEVQPDGTERLITIGG